MKRDRIKTAYRPMFIATILIGGIAGVLLEILYKKMYSQIWTPLMVAIYFTVLAAVMAIAIGVLCLAKGDKELARASKVGLIILLVLVFGISLVAEVLYELGANKTLEVKGTTAYIFIIDNSGSMAGNDPDNKREAAIERIMSEKGRDKLYAVYSFASGCQMVHPLTEYGKGTFVFNFSAIGGTNIVGALRNVIRENDSLYDQGVSAKAILVTDGGSSSVGLKKVLKDYLSHGISISTIGVGENIGHEMLAKIADGTGGVYISIDDIDQLDTAMEVAVQKNKAELKRNLLSERFVAKNNTVYAILKVVLLSIIGVLFVIVKGVIINDSQDQNRLIVLSGAAVVVAALLMELGVEIIGLNERLTRIIMCVLFCVAVAMKTKVVVQKSGGFFEEDEFFTGGKNKEDSGAQLARTKRDNFDNKGLM